MAIDSASARTFDIGSVFSNTFSVIGHNFVNFAIIAAFSEIPGVAFSWYMTGLNPFARAQVVIPSGMSPFSYSAIFVGGGLLAFVFSCVLQAALIHGTVADLNGRRASFVDCLMTGLRSFVPVFAIGLIAALAIIVGLVLIVVPGVILWVAWSVTVPVRVVERKPIFDVFGRSWELTDGYRWPILGLFVIFGIGSVILQWVVTPLAGLTSAAGGSIIFIGAAAIVRIVLATFRATMAGVIYYELRSVKEGIGPEALAAVFD